MISSTHWDLGAPPPSSRAFSKAEIVQMIRQMIVTGDLAPGQRLPVPDLCELLGVRRSALQAALTTLTYEGLVERLANQGVRVRVVDLEEGLQMAECRLLLEGFCAARAAERITDEQIKVLRQMGAQLRRRVLDGDVTGFQQVANQIFEFYLAIANHRVASEICGRLRERSTRHRFRVAFSPGRARALLPFWQELVDGICARDAAAAPEVVQRHSLNVLEAMAALNTDQPLAGDRRVEL